MHLKSIYAAYLIMIQIFFVFMLYLKLNTCKSD